MVTWRWSTDRLQWPGMDHRCGRYSTKDRGGSWQLSLYCCESFLSCLAIFMEDTTYRRTMKESTPQTIVGSQTAGHGERMALAPMLALLVVPVAKTHDVVSGMLLRGIHFEKEPIRERYCHNRRLAKFPCMYHCTCIGDHRFRLCNIRNITKQRR